MIPAAKEQGFSTVELLLSLFIAAAFIGAGFQLFSVVTKDSNEARLRAAAATIVNTTIQEHIGNASSPCAPAHAADTLTIPTEKLPQATAAITYSCPYGDSSKTTRVNVVVKYGSPQETVEGGLDVTR